MGLILMFSLKYIYFFKYYNYFIILINFVYIAIYLKFLIKLFLG